MLMQHTQTVNCPKHLGLTILLLGKEETESVTTQSTLDCDQKLDRKKKMRYSERKNKFVPCK